MIENHASNTVLKIIFIVIFAGYNSEERNLA